MVRMAASLPKVTYKRTLVGPVGALGKVYLRRLVARDTRALAAADAATPYEPNVFADELMTRLGQKEDGAALTAADLAQLKPDERATIVAELLRQNDYFFVEPKTSLSENEKADGAGEAPNNEIVVPRQADETDEAYLLRGWQVYEHGLGAKIAEVLKPFWGLSAAAKAAIGPALQANLNASNSVADLVAQARSMPSLRKDTFDRLNIPPHPSVKTNALLTAMSDDMANMRELTASSAAMQQSLNHVARTILAEFMAGVEESKKSTGLVLLIAKISLAVSVLAFVGSLGTAWFQDHQAAVRDQDADGLDARLEH